MRKSTNAVFSSASDQNVLDYCFTACSQVKDLSKPQLWLGLICPLQLNLCRDCPPSPAARLHLDALEAQLAFVNPNVLFACPMQKQNYSYAFSIYTAGGILRAFIGKAVVFPAPSKSIC